MSNARTLAGLVPDGLDSYEEGSFTPVATGGTNKCTFSSATGKYIKVGNKVTIIVDLVASSAGAPYFSNLPFTNGNLSSCGILRENDYTGYAWQLFINSNATTTLVLRYDNSSGGSSSHRYHGTATYFTS